MADYLVVVPYMGETYNLEVEMDAGNVGREMIPVMAELFAAEVGVSVGEMEAHLNSLQMIPHANKLQVRFEVAAVYG